MNNMYMKEGWVLNLTDYEALVIYSLLLHAKNNSIKPTDEEILKVKNYLTYQKVKDIKLDEEIEKIKKYEEGKNKCTTNTNKH